MSDLISREEAEKLLFTEFDQQDTYLPVHFKELILEECKAVDAVPVVHAHWKGDARYPDMKYCTACEYEPPDDPRIDTYDNRWLTVQLNFCPNCGARMDEEELSDEVD